MLKSPGGLEQLRALKFLERIVGAIAASDDIAAHMQSIVRETTEITGTDVCSFYVWDPEDERLVLTATHGLPTDAIGELKLALGEGITGWVAQHRMSTALLDVHKDPRFVWIPGVDHARFRSILSMPVLHGERLHGVLNVQTQDEHEFSAAETEFLATIAAHLASIMEITGLNRQLALVDALQTSEERLRQAQKMEAVGLLAGGVAHDFNNLLTAIIGFAHLVKQQLPEESPLERPVSEIIRAGDRAATLTSQLLAFSRRQVLQPEVLDLNDVVSDVGRLLGRLIGENIEVATVTTRNLGAVFVDRGQIEQVILNLAVNARDAMPNGGKLTIETGNIDLDDTYLNLHDGHEIGINRAGTYVMLAVSDTGAGMDPEVQAHIFEPFFTTKDVGKGTGLGLATVYGIVKQSGGDIWVYSEPGIGTTFKVYFPLHETAASTQQPATEGEAPRGNETILLVEDETGVRGLGRIVLEECGYRVLDAASAEDALQIAAQFPGKIHLLLSDLVLPGISGRELYEHLSIGRPGTRKLFMSGYTDDVVVRHGILSAELAFLQKPFTPLVLAQAVREALDETPRRN